METSFTSRRQATQPVPQFNISLPPPAEIPSTRYPNHAPAILSPRYNDSHVGPREAIASASTAATPTTTTSSSSHVVLPSPPPFTQPPASSSSIASPSTNRSSTFLPHLSSTSRDSTITSTSILTPKPGIASEGLSPSPGGNSGSSQSSQPGGGSGIYYQPIGSWAQSSAHTPSYTYATATNHNSTSNSSSVVPQSFASRSLYGGVSPSIPQFPARTSSSSTNGETLPNPPSYQDQSPFPTPISAGAGSLGSNYSQAPGAATHPALSQSSILSSQSSNSPQPPTPTQQAGNSGAAQAGHDGPSYRAPPTPNSYYPASTTPQQNSFAAFSGPPHHSPTTHSPTTTGGPSRGLSALSSGMAPPLPYGAGRMQSYPSPYQMPGGPVMSNMHHPGAPLSMVGGMHGLPHHYGMAHSPYYAAHSGPPANDRPFKCDECMQSFNRNHDLKRHKRIHLAVKPFPCTHCDKSFSRKDALKRHKLVKGCGSNKGGSEGGASATNGGSPPDRSDATSEDTAETLTPKREP